MNPYLGATIAMCLILLAALAITAYLAIFFNRRAKADLKTAFYPLAETLVGEADVEAAEVSGRYGGYLAFARMTNAQEGLGREFQTEIIDAAGGADWDYKFAPLGAEGLPVGSFSSDSPHLRTLVPRFLAEIPQVRINTRGERFRVAYSASSGYVRLTKPMVSRKDIPDTTTFVAQLEYLIKVAEANRNLQIPPYVDVPGMEI